MKEVLVKKTRTFSVYPASFGVLLLATTSLLSACVGMVDVGDAIGGSGGGSGDATGGASGEATDCSESDASGRADYDAWRSQTNDFGALAGGVFVGYIEGGEDLTLTIGADHSATLLVGAAAPPPVADQGYLCDGANVCEPERQLASGGTYPLHGASFEDGRLTIPFHTMAAYEPWCVLQAPHSWGDCNYAVYPSGEVSWSSDSCQIAGEEVDCEYFSLVFDGQACRCTSEECFAAVYSEPSRLVDVRFDAVEDKLEGSIGEANVHLFRVAE